MGSFQLTATPYFCTEFAQTKFEFAVKQSGDIEPKQVMKNFRGQKKLELQDLKEQGLSICHRAKLVSCILLWKTLLMRLFIRSMMKKLTVSIQYFSKLMMDRILLILTKSILKLSSLNLLPTLKTDRKNQELKLMKGQLKLIKIKLQNWISQSLFLSFLVKKFKSC